MGFEEIYIFCKLTYIYSVGLTKIEKIQKLQNPPDNNALCKIISIMLLWCKYDSCLAQNFRDDEFYADNEAKVMGLRNNRLTLIGMSYKIKKNAHLQHQLGAFALRLNGINPQKSLEIFDENSDDKI